MTTFPEALKAAHEHEEVVSAPWSAEKMPFAGYRVLGPGKPGFRRIIADGLSLEEANLICLLRNAAPELIALLEAATPEKLRRIASIMDLFDSVVTKATITPPELSDSLKSFCEGKAVQTDVRAWADLLDALNAAVPQDPQEVAK